VKRSSLFLAAALAAATGVNVVLWSAFVDSSGHASRLHTELLMARARQRAAELDASLAMGRPSPSVFAPHSFLPTAEDPALTEVSGG
jgi:hypothetical protein